MNGSDLTARIAALLSELNNVTTGHYSSDRKALLFKPGTYETDIEVGYYVQVLGLGERPEDVQFTSAWGVHSKPMGAIPDPGSLDNFWRSAENFHHASPWGMLWAVSQASPIRRIRVDKNLTLSVPGAWASGGYMADMQVGGSTVLGGQQQWIVRNSNISTTDAAVLGGQWNVVLVGCTGSPRETLPAEGSKTALTNVALTPVIAEKPYITIEATGRYNLQVPKPKFRSVGPAVEEATTVPFEQVYVARVEDLTSTIQSKLTSGLHVVLSPGIYNLTATLTLTFKNQVLLGIGMATLVAPKDGSPCVLVENAATGARVAGIVLQANFAFDKATGSPPPSSLLEWGRSGVTAGEADPANPGVLSDVFARVGGPDTDRKIGADVAVHIYSDNVVGDNLWLWRADHALIDPNAGEQKDPQNSAALMEDRVPKAKEYYLVASGDYPAKVGLKVSGDQVTIYGLAVEHFLEDNTLWMGEGGAVYFYQNELPYDVDQANFGDKGFAGYKVAPHVRTHEAQGMGVYSYFRDFKCIVNSGFVGPSTDGVRFTNIFTRFLNGKAGIEHVLNDQGGSVMGFSDPLSRLVTSVPGPPLCPSVPPLRPPGSPFWSYFLVALASAAVGWMASMAFFRWRRGQSLCPRSYDSTESADESDYEKSS